MIKAIIFDIAGVVMTQKRNTYEYMAELLGVEKKKLVEIYKKHSYELKTGKMNAKEFADILEKEFETGKDVIEVWKKAYSESKEENKEIVALLRKLRKNYKVGTISNANEIGTKLKKGMVREMFDFAVFSYDVGAVKPERKIFLAALENAGFSAPECVFVDDDEDNLREAKEMGFEVIHFRDNEQTVRELKSLGVKF